MSRLYLSTFSSVPAMASPGTPPDVPAQSPVPGTPDVPDPHPPAVPVPVPPPGIDPDPDVTVPVRLPGDGGVPAQAMVCGITDCP